MKKFRKIMAILVAALMIVAMWAPAMVFAAPAANGKVTVDNAYPKETYTLYKVFDLTFGTKEAGNDNTVSVPATDSQVAIEGTYKPVAYTYTKNPATDNFYNDLTTSGYFTLTEIQSTGVFNVERKQGATEQNIIDTIKTAINAGHIPYNGTVSSIVANDNANNVVWNSLAQGYYYVTSSTGSLITIDSTMNEVIVKEKNVIPTSEKKVYNSKTSEWVLTSDNAEIGDEVKFQIKVTDGKGTNKEIIVHDKMSNDLTLKQNSFKITVDGVDVPTTNYTIYIDKDLKTDTTGTAITVDKSVDLSTTPISTLHTVDDDSFVIIFTEGYIGTLVEGKNILIEYSAILNQDAVVTTPASNFSKISYSNQTSTGNEVTVKTYDVDILKYKEGANGTPIANAVFQLQNSSEQRLWLTRGTDVTGYDVYELAENQPTDFTGLTAVYDTRDPDILIGYQNSSNVMVYYNAIITTDSNRVRIAGLDVDETKYYLEELEAPNGYYKQTAKTEITPNASSTDFTDVSVMNKAGTELPSTGGMGTTVLYIVGGMLVILAGAYLFFSRKKTA